MMQLCLSHWESRYVEIVPFHICCCVRKIYNSSNFLIILACFWFYCSCQNCVGQSLAMAESYGIIARICSEYELILETEGCYEYSLTVKPVGFMLRFRKWV